MVKLLPPCHLLTHRPDLITFCFTDSVYVWSVHQPSLFIWRRSMWGKKKKKNGVTMHIRYSAGVDHGSAWNLHLFRTRTAVCHFGDTCSIPSVTLSQIIILYHFDKMESCILPHSTGGRDAHRVTGNISILHYLPCQVLYMEWCCTYCTVCICVCVCVSARVCVGSHSTACGCQWWLVSGDSVREHFVGIACAAMGRFVWSFVKVPLTAAVCQFYHSINCAWNVSKSGKK